MPEQHPIKAYRYRFVLAINPVLGIHALDRVLLDFKLALDQVDNPIFPDACLSIDLLFKATVYF